LLGTAATRCLGARVRRPQWPSHRATLSRTPQRLERDDDPGVQLQHDPVPAEPSRGSKVSRIQARTGGYAARHPAMSKVLGWLGWDNPGGSMNP
jgi:hypothetical protein